MLDNKIQRITVIRSNEGEQSLLKFGPNWVNREKIIRKPTVYDVLFEFRPIYPKG